MNVDASTEEDAFRNTLENISDGKSGQKVDLGYLEFDDQGELWRMKNADGGSTQLNVVLKDLQQKTKRGPLKVLVFIHGWNNSASPENEKGGNLYSFKSMLESLSHSCDVPLYGIYVAWRGSTWPRPTLVDVWDRDATAKRVGGPTMLTALRAISSTAHEANSKNTVIMVGHSFGGKILTQVTSQHLAGEIGRALGSKESKIVPLADTVVVINSAANGPEMRQINELMSVHRITYRQGSLDVPLFVTVASESDFLVKRMLPIYFRLNRDVLAFPDRGGHVASRKENDSLYRAMGHNPDLLNFRFEDSSHKSHGRIAWKGDESVHDAVIKNIENGKHATNSGFNLWLQTTTDPSSGQIFRIVPTQRQVSEDFPQGYQSPHWGFTVPDFAVSKHSGLWQPNFVGIISLLNGMTRQPGPSGPKTAPPTLKLQRGLY